MFWLSHHREDEYNRTYVLGGVRVCARCLGTYPVLLACMSALFALRAPLQWKWDVPVVLGLTLPALVDWSLGRFRPASGSNPVRTGTGVLLGLALGRSRRGAGDAMADYRQRTPEALPAAAAPEGLAASAARHTRARSPRGASASARPSGSSSP